MRRTATATTTKAFTGMRNVQRWWWTTMAGVGVLLLVLSSGTVAYRSGSHYGANRRILMENIKTLTFFADENTSYQRTYPLPQLICKGKPCSRFQPDVVQCQSTGNGQWKCEAQLPPSMRMGRVQVSCEGWDHADDPYVLKDSCSLTYHLLPSFDHDGDARTGYNPFSTTQETPFFFKLLFWGVLLFIIVSFMRTWLGRNEAVRPSGGAPRPWWGGGWNGGSWWSPPPPPPSPSPPPPYSHYPKHESGSSSSSDQNRPGFWSGLGLGGLAAWLLSSRRNQPYYPVPPPVPSSSRYSSFDSRPSPSSSSSFFSAPRRPEYDRSTRRYYNDDDGFGSSSLHSSTGYGGTRNR